MLTENRKPKTVNRLLVAVDRFGREYLSTPADRRLAALTVIPLALALALVFLTGIIMYPLPW